MRSIEVCNRVGRWPPRLWLLTLKTRTRKRFTGNSESSNSLASRGDYFSRWARLKNYFVGRSKHEKPQPALPPDVGSGSPRGHRASMRSAGDLLPVAVSLDQSAA